MNKVVHFEIPFDNKARAVKFYGEVFGWQLNEIPDMSYVMARTSAVDKHQMPTERGTINGGMMQRPAEAPHVVIYVGVGDVSAALTKATAAGGRVVTPNTPIPGMGAYGRIADPEGNIIGLFAPPAAATPSSGSSRRARSAGRKKPAVKRGKSRASKRRM